MRPIYAPLPAGGHTGVGQPMQMWSGYEMQPPAGVHGPPARIPMLFGGHPPFAYGYATATMPSDESSEEEQNVEIEGGYYEDQTS
jgi:hypothetical protein